MRINQRINFYIDDFRPPVIPLPANKMAGMLVALMVVLTLVAAALGYPVWTKEQEIASLKKELSMRQSELEETKQKFPKVAIDKSLNQSLGVLKKENLSKKKLLKHLESDQIEDGQSFSRVFNDLETHDDKDVWLTRVDLMMGGNAVRLTGLVAQPDVLPNYIDGLKEAHSFTGRAFNLFDLERDSDNSRYLHFILSTDTKAKQEGEG